MKNELLDKRKIVAGKYKHYKGDEYQVLDTVYHSETQELLVLYRALYGAAELWVRPYDMFTESVQVNGEDVARFQLIE
jgi:hypothetical protein